MTPKLTFALTDPHGCLDMLNALIARCEAYAEGKGVADPRFVFLGDYVDRGPDSAGVVRRVREMQDAKGAVAIRGNHDNMMVETFLAGDSADWQHNGMRSAARSYGFTDKTISDAVTILAMSRDDRVMDDVYWMESLPLIFEDDLRYFVHAGINPARAIADQRDFDLMWIRDPFLMHRGRFPKFVVHGHTPHRGHPQPDFANRCNLDTGAVHYGLMTAGVFTDQKAGPLEFLYVTREELDKMKESASPIED